MSELLLNKGGYPKAQPGVSKEYLVAKYHKPRISVIIPHYNYSEFLGDAILSLQQQSHENFQCVVVDDRSDEGHFSIAEKLVAELRDSRFRIIRNEKNVGMVHSIYNGLDQCDAAFSSILDPDDRYDPTFLERMLALHLSPVLYCPLVCCDQYLLRLGDGIISGTQSARGTGVFDPERSHREQICFEQFGFHRYVPPLENGWHWSTTSSMMFRRDALLTFRPTKELTYPGQGDSYCAQGAHMLGGTILLDEPLVYRGLHKRNDFISDSVFSIFFEQAKAGAEFLSDRVRIDVVDAFLANEGLDMVEIGSFREVILAHFPGSQLQDLVAAVPQVSELLLRGKNNVETDVTQG